MVHPHNVLIFLRLVNRWPDRQIRHWHVTARLERRHARLRRYRRVIPRLSDAPEGRQAPLRGHPVGWANGRRSVWKQVGDLIRFLAGSGGNPTLEILSEGSRHSALPDRLSVLALRMEFARGSRRTEDVCKDCAINT